MKRTLIYVGAFFLGLLCINVGFYLVPIYHLPWSHDAILGPLSVYLAYFIFGMPLIVIFFRQALKDSWSRALLKGAATVIVNVIVMGTFAYLFMHAAGKL